MSSIRSDVVYRRTYSRPTDGTGKNFETWTQSVDRIIDHQIWLWERAAGRPLIQTEFEELLELRSLIFDRKVAPAGRVLWLGGTEIGRTRESSLFNCLGGETLVLTKEFGNVPIKDLVGLNFHVLNSNSEWVPATCKSGGVQRLYNVTFNDSGRGKTTVRATAGHRWWLDCGDRTTTEELRKGNKIPFVRPLDSEGFNVHGFIHGLIFADGTVQNRGTMYEGYAIRLCKHKADFLSIFESLGYSVTYPPSQDGDPFVRLGKTSDFEQDLKDLPVTQDQDYIASFLRGVLSGDGDKDGLGVTGTKELCDYFIRYVHLIGHVTMGLRELPKVTNFGTRNVPCYRLRFRRHDSPWFFSSTEDTGVEEEVFCCEVPEHEEFTLDKGLLTSNCAFLKVETVYDLVDVLWLLMQGCGVGAAPVPGTLSGFRKHIKEIQVVRSKATGKTGIDHNEEIWDSETKTWTIKIGDSAEAWAKGLGKLVAGKYPANKLVLDFSNIRPAGERLKGYGWISSGDEQISKGFKAIAEILNSRTDQLLTKINIMDIVNWLGTVLSSRRSAQIMLFDYGAPEWQEFAIAKKNWWDTGEVQRQQSNNSLVFRSKPSIEELEFIFDLMQEAGGSEPGFINMEAALKRAPWCAGLNPCAEVLLANKSFCNLTETDVGKFKNDQTGLYRAIYLAARMNYRQTCVNLKDGILQEAWHLNNDFLRLCGVGLTGVARRPDMQGYDFTNLERTATFGAYSMADELDMPRPKNITVVKPSGTISKVMDTTEGLHKPLGKYIFNNIQFSKYDPLVETLANAGYNVFNHPTDETGVLITFPVKWDDVHFDLVDGKEVNLETAIDQLERYKMLQNHWCQQNTSCTVSYSPDEIPDIIHWLDKNWDSYVGVSFLYRTDPTKTAKDLGYLYLPQEVVTKEEYEAYVSRLLPVDFETVAPSFEEIQNEECSSGMCPIK